MKRITTALLCLLLTLTLLLSATSCATVKATELSEGYRRAVEEGKMDASFVTHAADFSLSLFNNALDPSGSNQLISPLSALLCLALVYNGTDGETLAEMEQVLVMSPDALNQSLFAYTSSLPVTEDSKLALANSIWFRDTDAFAVEEQFLQTNADWFGAEIYKAPFDSSTVKDINSWCKKQTDGMIDSMIDEIPENGLMYLINALVFDAKWEEKYEKNDIRDRTFKSADGTSSLVDMMFSEESTYLTGDGFRGFAKDYKGRGYSFVGLLPDEEGNIFDFAKTLDGETWMQMWNNRRNASVDVGIPEFTYSVDLDMTPALKAMGMEKMFVDSDADFSKLGQYAEGNIYCDSVMQKTFIEVNRHGTKAAAITWSFMAGEAEMETKSVILDRPFVYAIVDNATGLPLFLGVVTAIH